MCYHNTLKIPAKELIENYDAPFEDENSFEIIFHANAFTFPLWPIVSNQNNVKIIAFSHWGLIPSWAHDEEDANHIRLNNLNARSETVFEKASFKNSIVHHRCLVPSTGYFEWQKKENKKFPYFISLKNEPIFSMAGILNTWINQNKEEVISTFAILTTQANNQLANIHNTKKRMPLILHRRDEEKWLSNNLSQNEIQQFSIPFPEEEMQFYTVSKIVSNFASQNSNIPEVTQPFIYPEFQQGSLF